ncbi:MAG TPA: DUF3667 domain-containing protein [Gemmatimonadales bacterium]|nr:DUF3667 domain-containing protein [Gemmatimonadales bacterium]
MDRFIKAFTSLDGRVMRSFGMLLRHPGSLTVAFLKGVRKQYASPVQLFLLANVLLFATQSLTRTNVFGSSLQSHLHHQDWSALAGSLVARRLERTQTTLDAYEPAFDRAVVLNAKSLVILMVPAFAGVLALLFVRRREPLMTHVVFSLHLYAFLMLLFSLAIVAAGLQHWMGGGGLDSPRVDTVLSLINVTACAAYLFLAIGPAYGARGLVRVVQSGVAALAVGALVLGYRFILLLITLTWT